MRQHDQDTLERDDPRGLPLGWATLICLAVLTSASGLGPPGWGLGILAAMVGLAGATDLYRWKLHRDRRVHAPAQRR